MDIEKKWVREMKALNFLKNKVALLYLVVSLIIISDVYINVIDHTSKLYDYIQFGKGIIFIIITTILIHFIVEKHQSYKMAEEKENELSILINSMPDFVNFKDGKGKWLRVNDFGKELFSLKEINPIGKSDIELAEIIPFFKDAFHHCDKSDITAWEAGRLTRCEESFPTKNGDNKTFDVIKVPLFDENNERKGLLTIGRDITPLKAAEALLVRKEKLSVVGELAAGIAHEIRNPLTSIKGFIQIMKESEHTPKEHIDIILMELERINQIVSEMLVLSKPQSHTFKNFPVTN